MDQTFVMLKPDTLERGLVGYIISKMEEKGYRIIDIKTFHLTEEILADHYSHLLDKPFFKDIVTYMTRGHVIGMIIEGEDAVSEVRKMVGATHFFDAKPGTIRGDFVLCVGENLIHSSDSKESAEKEIRKFFHSDYDL